MAAPMYRGGLALALALTTSACTLPDAEPPVPEADPAAFRDRVYPVILADCGFNRCHGDPDRFFAVFGPARGRLRPDTDIDAPPTAEELAVSFTRARSMLVSRDGIQRAPLLRKPLSTDDGGVGHAGSDPWGQGIYPSKADPRFQVLVGWALASTPGDGS
jgi:hypothetical protein